MFHRIPLAGKEIDPLNVFSKLAESQGYAFLLESCGSPSEVSRYSILGADPFLIFKSQGKEIELVRRDRRDKFQAEPFPLIKQILKTYHVLHQPNLPPFVTGAVGLLGYDLVHQFETLPATTRDDLGCPDIHLMFVDLAIVIDKVDRAAYIISLVGTDEDAVKNLHRARLRIGETLDIVESCIYKKKGGSGAFAKAPRRTKARKPQIRSNMTAEAYREMVRQAKKYIRKGDIYQANLSQRFVCRYQEPGINLYETLRKINPAPFASYMRLGGMEIVSSSPERLFRVEDNKITTRPIAGTRPRGETNEHDEALRSELLLSEKERAEHLMLVDLERNDIGRVSKLGSVKVEEFMTVEDYSHVKHIVSSIAGELEDRYEPLDAVKALFPGGTITGVPKIRCMEIIDKLEMYRRGAYSGCVGYLSFDGGIDLSILIRNFLLTGGKAYFQAGGGIVADSDPEEEYQESLNKAQALREAVRLTLGG